MSFIWLKEHSAEAVPTGMASKISLIPRLSLSLSSAITILEAGKKELVKREEGLVKLIT